MSDKKTDFWYYTRRERQATLALLILAILVFLFPAVYQFRPAGETSVDRRDFLQAIEELEQMQEKAAPLRVAAAFYFDPNAADLETLEQLGLPAATARTIIKYREKVGRFHSVEDLQKIYNLREEDFQRLAPYIKIAAAPKKAAPQATPRATVQPEEFPFDPNAATYRELVRLGLPEKTAATLIRYREKGGTFRKKEDMKKIYGLREQDYQRLEAFITLPLADAAIRSDRFADDLQPEQPARAVPASYAAPAPVSIDINQATAEEWQLLYGIGPVLSQRIVRFRDKLGGFVRIEQVAETYGLPDSTFQSIQDQLRFSPIRERIAINRADARELQAHPYIQWKQANVIVAYRSNHGPFATVADLEKVLALNKEFIQRIAPYIQFD
ncbi:ComEA family DNA-binding protein [Flavilitoribacter nigricans]|uniref:Helix-hairpin-helix domain-containing protein n=1 Tax=Flavilitoribacter nigricans (strain ATCC 23147 / DSM 23189 / NBRC 102662 / NCIMB 1420 / SS-2) TaxID=1122177 RepID=A0A2D0NFM9_FLAN2|nr:helix-hairpin-helix domain-containing protein [Flavilitoribacter nigricans]PHN07190.1 hypothetical protein CRP01_08170 [Flavilitoribacter nigricans DSM 23189 = NBRC 102662]